MAMSVAAHTSASRVWSVGHENALNRSCAQERGLAEAARSRPLTQTSVRRDLIRDSPDESQTGINVRVFPALLQERRGVLTATSTSGNPNAWSRVRPGHFPWHLDALLLSADP